MIFLLVACALACPFNRKELQHLLEDPKIRALHELGNSAPCIPKEDQEETTKTLKSDILNGAADADTRTPDDCVCSSTCSGSPDSNGGLCDWCYTSHSRTNPSQNCGDMAPTRQFKNYDWCQYPVDSNYESQLATQKLNYHWSKVMEDQTPSAYANPLGLLGTSVHTTFDVMWDHMPAERPKYIHGVGATCKFKQTVFASGYTGLFKQNSESIGLIRMGSAIDIDAKTGVTPGIGLKFFRARKTSGNFVLLISLKGSHDYNFFRGNFSNHILPPTEIATIVLGHKFKQASGCIGRVGLSDMAKYDIMGNAESNVKFPYQIVYEPLVSTTSSASEDANDYVKRLEQFKSGAQLFNIFAKRTPTAAFEPFGTLTLSSDCTASKYGDEHLFFRHQRIEEDLAMEPTWEPQIDLNKWCGVNQIPDVTYCPSHDVEPHTFENLMRKSEQKK